MNLKVGDLLICHKQHLKKRRYLLGQIIKIIMFEESDDCAVKAKACLPGSSTHDSQYSYDYLEKHYRLANSLDLLHNSDTIEKLKEVSNG